MVSPDLPRPEAVRSRELERHGLTRHVVRGRGWSSPTRGVRVPPGTPGSLAATCRAVLLALPAHAVVTHLTAASLRGWWLPVGLTTVPCIVSTDDEAPHHDRRGVYVRRCRVPDGHRSELDGVRIASAAWTIAELAEHLSLIDLTAIIDCALNREDVTIAELWAVCVRGRRGVRTLRQAIRLSDARSESYWETVLRLLHVLSGIETVRPQAWLYDGDDFVARADLPLEGTNRLHEYDGGEHRLPDVQDDDLDRDRRLVRHGWDRLAYTSRVIVDDPGQVVRDAATAYGRAYDPADLSGWLYEAARSSLTPVGRRALHGRLGRFARAAPPRRTAHSAADLG